MRLRSAMLRLWMLLGLIVGLLGVTGDAAARTQAEDLLDRVKSHGQFNVFARALEATDYGRQIKAGGTYTIFAFTDHAFSRLPAGIQEVLFTPAGRPWLDKIMAHHVIPGRATSADLFGGTRTVESIEGYPITIEGHLKFIRVNGSTILQADIPAINGVIHLLDYVIIPPDL
ncbi:MAG: fasciclin domain-containing protein [Pseudomonadota bacterium]